MIYDAVALEKKMKMKILLTGGTIAMNVGNCGLTSDENFGAVLRSRLASLGGDLGSDWSISEVPPLRDSANVDPEYWLILRQAILHASKWKNAPAFWFCMEPIQWLTRLRQ
ncbi:hypothetical protein QN386_15915 [Pseudomonas sp. CCI3.2]|uniref:hypothetical protein n=1 Tax=unclassified Pseudomonas TaxID=196821 RepID=UPI002AC91BB5|nr:MULTISPECIES: hypothetical protein [unclassified Pseudomonas]MEB0077902.1 hypothetical protein [Pseudomonas sp. MH10out]MEB0102800.1 hypothetical protein [Pseudomonas sp. CCI3.2]MEB0131722.1 hypothetical protein [Pseudomonas sp. CCI2.4]MEB0159495.1 hypothetical protein [Pseudomonas sp. AH2 (2023)]MEB0170250.1 hypothetical protein [Pseudomonas sp. CCC4.4]